MKARGEVFVLRVDGEPCWKVRWGGRVCSPEWEERGPALAYLAGLGRGRKPEYAQRSLEGEAKPKGGRT